MAIAEDERVQVIGINYKDRPAKAAQFLAERGNPYDLLNGAYTACPKPIWWTRPA